MFDGLKVSFCENIRDDPEGTEFIRWLEEA